MIGALLTVTAAAVSEQHASQLISKATDYAGMFERYVQLTLDFNDDHHFKGCKEVSTAWQLYCKDVTDVVCDEPAVREIDDDTDPNYKLKRICCTDDDNYDQALMRNRYVKSTCEDGADEFEMLPDGTKCDDNGADGCKTWREHQTTYETRGCCDACIGDASHPAYDATCTREAFKGAVVCPEDDDGNEVKPDWLASCTTSGGFDANVADEDSQGCEDYCSYSIDGGDECPEGETCDMDEGRVALKDADGNLMSECPPETDGKVPGCPDGKHCHRSWMCVAPESDWECESSTAMLEALYAHFLANNKWADIADIIAWHEDIFEDDTMGGFLEYMRFLAFAAVPAVEGYSRPKIDLNPIKGECAVALLEPFTEGIISATGGNIFVYKPTSRTGGEIDLGGDASATVIGGYNHGTVKATSSGTVLIIGTDNAGPILADGAGDVIISQVTNAGAVTVVNGAKITILDTTNTGDITVSGDSDFTVDGAVNSGTITITGGKLNLKNVVNAGTITVSNAEISGEVLADTGTVKLIDCTGSLSVPSGADETKYVTGGTIKFTEHTKDSSDYTVPNFFIGDDNGSDNDDGSDNDEGGGDDTDTDGDDDSAMAVVASAAFALVGIVVAI